MAVSCFALSVVQVREAGVLWKVLSAWGFVIQAPLGEGCRFPRCRQQA